jgi:hypothetical protein
MEALMTRFVLLMTCALCTVVLSAQTPVHQDPHHHVVFEDRDLRILDVNIAAGETGRDHLHANDVLTVSLSASETRVRPQGAAWGEARPLRQLGEVNVTEYAGRPGVHAVWNVGRGLFRLLAVENLKQAGWTEAPVLTGAGTTLLRETRAFRAYGIELSADLRETTLTPVAPVVAVLVTGEAAVTRIGGRPLRLDQSKRWTVLGSSGTFRVTAQGNNGARIVGIEVR